MELLHLKYFLTVAKTEHMTKAAHELRIAQPALSKIIRNLEKELEVKLFDRRGRSIILNDTGKYFSEKVEEALVILDDTVNDVKEFDLIEKNKKVRFLSLCASSIVADILIAFKSAYPDIQLELTQSLSDLDNNFDSYDLCLYCTNKPNPYKNSLCLLEEEIFLGVSTKHPLANKGTITLQEVKNENFIALGQGHLRNLIYDFCKTAGFKPNITFESTNNSLIRDLIVFGQGVAFIPEISWKLDNYNGIKFLHIKKPFCNRSIYLYTKYTDNSPLNVQIFKDFIINHFKTIQI
ncbi:LysR family transcriptional regulator [Terrisporobacter glycolicus]|nr:LysR family transcriptional regulator [Terrisporobacter glycolicus]